MRLRTPNPPQGLAISEEKIPASKSKTLSYKVTVITPIYGGGVQAGKPDREMPIRASAIRGQLRYWWRFLQSHGEGSLTGEKLFKKEREVWGGMGDESEQTETTDFSGKVFVRVKGIKNAGNNKFKPCCEYSRYKDGKIKYNLTFLHDIPQYALFPGQGKKPDAQDYDEIKDSPHTVILPGITFQLEISIEKSVLEIDQKRIIESLRWWASFGGIGARVRRGSGSVKVEDIKPLTEKEVKHFGCILKRNSAINAPQAWNKAITKLHQFRQGVGVGRNQKKDSQGNLETYGKNNTPAQGGSRWPEPDSIREITGRNSSRHKPKHAARLAFPRAAFGLPIIFRFNNRDEQAGDPEQSELRPIDSERMLSPLILKAMATENGYQSIALLLPVDNQASLQLELHGIPDKPEELAAQKEREWKAKNWDKWPESWWNPSKFLDVDPIHSNNANDPLTAFMNYFKPENGGNI